MEPKEEAARARTDSASSARAFATSPATVLASAFMPVKISRTRHLVSGARSSKPATRIGRSVWPNGSISLNVASATARQESKRLPSRGRERANTFALSALACLPIIRAPAKTTSSWSSATNRVPSSRLRPPSRLARARKEAAMLRMPWSELADSRMNISMFSGTAGSRPRMKAIASLRASSFLVAAARMTR